MRSSLFFGLFLSTFILFQSCTKAGPFLTGQPVIISVNQQGLATVAIPGGSQVVLRAIINPFGNNPGRLIGDGFITQSPVYPTEWMLSPTGQWSVVNWTYNEVAGFNAYTATVWVVEGTPLPDGSVTYAIRQVNGAASPINVNNYWTYFRPGSTGPIPMYKQIQVTKDWLYGPTMPRYNVGL